MKIRQLTIAIIITFIAPNIYSQTLSNLDFGTVTLGESRIDELVFSTDEVEWVELLSAEIVGNSNVYSVVDFTPIRVNKGDVANIKIQFAPKDNIQYRSFLKLKVKTNLLEYAIMSQIKSNVTHFNDIYKGSDNLKGTALIHWLANFVQPHTSLTYSEARNLMWGEIDNFGGEVECIYTGRKVIASGIPNANETNFDTEHTWPQSLGAKQEPPKSDLFHIRPTYRPANNKRANTPFGYVLSGVSYEDGGSKLGIGKNNTLVFEPRDIVKGDIARGMYYFAVCYNNPTNYIDSQEEDLKQFAINDPVDAKEMARNDAIFKYQHNRNPFIDNENFLFRFNTIANPDFSKKSFAHVSSEDIVMAGVGSNKATLYIANIGDTTIQIISHSFNQNGSGHSYSLKLLSDIDNLEISPNSLAKIELVLDANETTLEPWQANLDISFDNGQLIPINFNILGSATSANDELSSAINVYPNPASQNINISLPAGMPIDPQYFSIVTVEGKVYNMNGKVKFSNGILTIDKSDIPCDNSLIYLMFGTNNQTITKPVVIK